MSSKRLPEGLENKNHSTQVYVTVGIAGFLQLSTTILRVITKLRRKLAISWDDYLIVLATCLNVTADAFDITAAVNGFGRHSEFLSSDQIIQAQKYAQLAVATAIFAKCTIKLSICCLLLNIIKRIHKYFIIAIKTLMSFTIITSFICAVLWGLQAKPITALWDPRVKGYRESGQKFIDTLYVIYAFGVVTDLFYSLSPVYLLWDLKIKPKTKITILALTGSGLLLTVIAVLGMVFAREFLSTEDETWIVMNVILCDIIERNIGCLIASLPVLRSIFNRQDKILRPHRRNNYLSFGRKQGHFVLKDEFGDDSINTVESMTGDERIPKPANVATAEMVALRPRLCDARGSDDAITLRDLAGTIEHTRIELQHEYSIDKEDLHGAERL